MAKTAKIVAVKVVDDYGYVPEPHSSDTFDSHYLQQWVRINFVSIFYCFYRPPNIYLFSVAGLEYVANIAPGIQRRAVVSASLGFTDSFGAVEASLGVLRALGIHVVVSYIQLLTTFSPAKHIRP